MVFRYPYLDPRFLACFSPLLIGLIAAHRFAKPRLRPWWLTILSCLWIISSPSSSARAQRPTS